jgi:hypothetical protein
MKWSTPTGLNGSPPVEQEETGSRNRKAKIREEKGSKTQRAIQRSEATAVVTV